MPAAARSRAWRLRAKLAFAAASRPARANWPSQLVLIEIKAGRRRAIIRYKFMNMRRRDLPRGLDASARQGRLADEELAGIHQGTGGAFADFARRRTRGH